MTNIVTQDLVLSVVCSDDICVHLLVSVVCSSLMTSVSIDVSEASFPSKSRYTPVVNISTIFRLCG